MRTIRTTVAVMLLGLAFTAFQPDAGAQTRRGGTTSQSSTRSSGGNKSATRSSSSASGSRSSSSASGSRSSSATTRSSASRASSSKATRPSTTVRRSTGTAVNQPTGTTGSRPSTTVGRPASGSAKKSSGTVVKPSSGVSTRPAGTVTRPSVRPSEGVPQTVRPGADPQKPIRVTRPGHTPGDRKAGRENRRPKVQPDRPAQIRPDHRPHVHRVHPRDRDFMHYSVPSYYWTGHNHYYGHRVRVLPTHVHRHVYYGRTYYCYNDIWYRPYGGYYVVCRPPFGTVLAANLIADMTWAAVRLSYYYTAVNTYSTINDNNRFIAEQNAIIAQNNATIAAQNAQIAASQQQAQAAYSLASQLGLVQSYAAANSNYYYQDGVFYEMDLSGQYKVIVPPAGALVETLPEDYDMVVLSDGNEYYKVDDTVYKIAISEGKPYFEVLGQLYS